MHLDKCVPVSVRRLIESDPTAPALDKHEQDVTVPSWTLPATPA